MNASTATRSASPKPRSLASYRLERRRAPRRVAAGRLTAVARPPRSASLTGRICSAQLLNLSETGLAAMVQEPLEIDSLVTFFFPAQGSQRGHDATGRVVRCIPGGFGHVVGIHFDPLVAA